MKNKLLAFLLLLIPSICSAYFPDDKVDTPEEVSQLNNSLQRLTSGKLDLRPGPIIPKTDSVYNLGAVGMEWNGLYVDTITASGLAVSTITASSATITQISASTITFTGTAAQQNTVGANNIVEAWVHFTSTGTLLIRGSYNVTSITDNGVGDFTINYTRAFEDVNYSLVGTAMYNAVPPIVCINNGASNVTTSTTKIYIINNSNANMDSSMISIMVVR